MIHRLSALFAVAVVTSLATVGCAVDPAAEGEEGTESGGESADHLLAGRKVSTTETATLLRQAGFPEAVIGKMVCTAKYESAFYERASNKNKNGSTDYGLFQINSIHIGEKNCPSAAALYDAATNARCALGIYKSQGINAWYGYQKHRTECNATAAPAGNATPTGADTGGASGADDEPGACYSATLGDMTAAKTCVQSKSNGVWYQCMDGQWYRGVTGNSGPYGACASVHAL